VPTPVITLLLAALLPLPLLLKAGRFLLAEVLVVLVVLVLLLLVVLVVLVLLLVLASAGAGAAVFVTGGA